MKQILLNLFTFFFLCIVSIQAQTTSGTDFWLTFGKNGNVFDPFELQIQIICGEEPATGSIYFTELSNSVDFSIVPYEVYMIALNSAQKFAVINQINGISNLSVHITCDKPVTVYAMNQSFRYTDATNVLPTTALGTDYYNISYKSYKDAEDAYAVVATQNNTQMYLDGELAATLDAGQVYYKSLSTDFTGTHITANNPVALFAVNQGAHIPEHYPFLDCLMQQVAPIKTWGKNFFVPVSHRAIDRVRIVASQNNTQIKQIGGVIQTVWNGQNSTTLQAGQFIELEVYLEREGCFIQADKPVGVCTYLTSGTYTEGIPGGGAPDPASDPAQSWLPAMEQTIPKALVAPFVPFGNSNINMHYALVVTAIATKEQTTVSIGGAPATNLSGSNWKDNADAGMSFYSMPLTNTSASYIFTNQKGLIIMIYGVGEAESYYYLGYSAMRNLSVEFYINDIYYYDSHSHVFCPSEIVFRAQVSGMNVAPESLKWYINGKEEDAAQGQLTWKKYFFTGEYDIKMVTYTSDKDSVVVETILHIGCQISTAASPLQGGSTTGDGCFLVNDEAVVTATPNSKYDFLNWTIDNVEVSVDNPYSFTVTKSVNIVANFVRSCFNFDNYATILWNNTFILNLNKIAEDGYELIGCKWYRNDIEENKSSTINDYSYSAGHYKTDLLELAPTYYQYELITKNHDTLCSSQKILTQYIDYKSGKILVYPNPVISGIPFTMVGITKDEPVQVYNQYGICVYNAMAHDTTIQLTLHLSSGLYLIRTGNNITKILVLE